MPAAHHAQQSDHGVDGCDLHYRREGFSRLLIVENLPSANRNRDEASRRQSGKQRMKIFAEHIGIGNQRKEVAHHRAPAFDCIADGVLHEGVGDENPKRRQVGAERDEPNASAMFCFAQLIPTENPNAEERRLEEECGQRLESERRTEDISHESSVLRPVHAEVKLLDDTGDDAHRKVDQKQRPEEFDQLLDFDAPLVTAAIDVPSLEYRGEDRQSESDGHEQEMINRRDRELPSRKQ